MSTVEVKIELPDELLNEAQAAGLLKPDQIERLVRQALRKRGIEKLRQAQQNLACDPLSPMTPEEIQAEIEADRPSLRGAPGP